VVLETLKGGQSAERARRVTCNENILDSGATVDQEALRDALCSRHLRSAWLDVTNPEPLPDHHPLWAEPNCHITPHIARGHAGEAITLVRHFLRNLEHFTCGQPLLDRVM
jgi:phosphoglycerate dehydrogenase-like enzyme